MSATKQEIVQEMKQIERDLKSGKITGKKNRFKASKRAAALRFRAKHFGKKPKSKAKPIDKNQGILPNFLAQMDTVKMEELLVQRLFKQIEQNVSKRVQELIEKVG